VRPRHDGKPAPGQDFDQFLHHALHAAADQVEPRPDGLERIRARVGADTVSASAVSASAVSASAVSASAVSASAVSASTGVLADRVRRWNARRAGHSAGDVW
jgi:hypothetical protein